MLGLGKMRQGWRRIMLGMQGKARALERGARAREVKEDLGSITLWLEEI